MQQVVSKCFLWLVKSYFCCAITFIVWTDSRLAFRRLRIEWDWTRHTTAKWWQKKLVKPDLQLRSLTFIGHTNAVTQYHFGCIWCSLAGPWQSFVSDCTAKWKIFGNFLLLANWSYKGNIAVIWKATVIIWMTSIKRHYFLARQFTLSKALKSWRKKTLLKY